MIPYSIIRLVDDLDDRAELEVLIQNLDRTRSGNKRKGEFYDMENIWVDLGVSIPDRFLQLKAVSGWASKAVDFLARRTRMESFTLPGSMDALDDFGLNELWYEDNRMETDLSMAITSSLIHSPGFLLTMLGDTTIGESEVVISSHDALHATGRWNWSRRGLDSALVVLDVDPNGTDPTGAATGTGEATRIMFFTGEGGVYEFRRDKRMGAYTNEWTVQREYAGIDRVPVEPLLFKPRIGRPFGSSRINAAVQYIINAAIRTVVRTELNAEFYAGPQRYALNVDEDELFSGGRTQWDALVSKMLAIGMSDDPEAPDPVLGQFAQASMQPHADMFRLLAGIFSGETQIPVSSLGVVHDQPASAEALYAGKEDLVLEAEECTRIWTPTIRRVALNAIQLRDGLAAPPEELRKLGLRWIDPSTPSRNQAGDFVMKQVAGGVLPPDSVVTLEGLGYSEPTIERIIADRRLAAARETVRQALAVRVDQEPVAPVAPPQVQSVEQFRESTNLPTEPPGATT